MLRAIPEIALAIQIANHTISDRTADAYALTLQKTASRHHFDPYTAVAVGRRESKWNPRLVGGAENKCHGLFQDCVQWTHRACKGDLYESAQCQSARAALLNPHQAIVTFGRRVSTWRTYCRRATKKPALFARWLAGYQGVDARRGSTCNQKKIRGVWVDQPRAPITKFVMNYRRMLIREVPRRLRQASRKRR